MEKGHKKQHHDHTDTKKLKEQLAEMTETAKRIQAEFENFKKREESAREDYLKSCNRELILKLVPVLENFELSLQNTHNQEEFRKGIELIILARLRGPRKAMAATATTRNMTFFT